MSLDKSLLRVQQDNSAFSRSSVVATSLTDGVLIADLDWLIPSEVTVFAKLLLEPECIQAVRTIQVRAKDRGILIGSLCRYRATAHCLREAKNIGSKVSDSSL